MAKILLADDEASIKTLVEDIILQNGHEFLYAQNGKEALSVFEAEHPDLLILDVMMPELNGFEVCDIVRAADASVPIMFLSAKGDIVDKSMGFRMGCDDYLVKPFSSTELGLRITALLRRGEATPREKAVQEDFSIGELSFDFKRHVVTCKGEPIDLTAKEFEILAFLASHPGQVFTREQLFSNVWDEAALGDVSTITVFVRKIREKIERDPSKPEYLLTVWGIGYKFAHQDPL